MEEGVPHGREDATTHNSSSVNPGGKIQVFLTLHVVISAPMNPSIAYPCNLSAKMTECS